MATFSGEVDCWWMKELEFFRMPATRQSVCVELFLSAILEHTLRPLRYILRAMGVSRRFVGQSHVGLHKRLSQQQRTAG